MHLHHRTIQKPSLGSRARSKVRVRASSGSYLTRSAGTWANSAISSLRANSTRSALGAARWCVHFDFLFLDIHLVWTVSDSERVLLRTHGAHLGHPSIWEGGFLEPPPGVQ